MICPVSPPVTRLEHALIGLLRLGSLPRVHDRLVSRAGVRVERGPYLALAAIGDAGSLRLSRLARQQGIDLSTASRHATRLCNDGLVERTVDARDHRAADLSLTPAGERVLADLRAARRDALGDALAGWDAADLDRLAGDIERLTRDIMNQLANQGDAHD